MKKDFYGKIEKTEYPNRSLVIAPDGRKAEIKGGLPGQTVRVKPLRSGKSRPRIKGKLMEVVEPAPYEEPSRCPHFPRCGGCDYQTVSYERELALKREQLEDLFGFPVSISSGSAPEGYRNKMEYTFGDEEKGGPLVLGLHARGQFHEIVPTPDCKIVHPDFTRIQSHVARYFRESDVPYYHRLHHQGTLRHLVVRRSWTTGEILLNLVTTSEQPLDREGFMKEIKNIPLEGKIVAVAHTINDGLGDAIIPDKVEWWTENTVIEERLCGLPFFIGPFSFFQTNSQSAEKLYESVKSKIPQDTGILFDLYSGTGTITRIVGEKVEKAVGIEINGEAVAAAKRETENFGPNNVEFLEGDVLHMVEELKEIPDVVILDPPREGIHPGALKKILDFSPSTFIYISCNPRAAAEEVQWFQKAGYTLTQGEALDQFPGTKNVEMILQWEKREKRV